MVSHSAWYWAAVNPIALEGGCQCDRLASSRKHVIGKMLSGLVGQELIFLEGRYSVTPLMLTIFPNYAHTKVSLRVQNLPFLPFFY